MTLASYQLTTAHKIRPTLNRPEMTALNGTADDLRRLIQSTRSYLASPQSDAREKLHLEGFLEELHSQLENVESQLEEQS